MHPERDDFSAPDEAKCRAFSRPLVIAPYRALLSVAQSTAVSRGIHHHEVQDFCKAAQFIEILITRPDVHHQIEDGRADEGVAQTTASLNPKSGVSPSWCVRDQQRKYAGRCVAVMVDACPLVNDGTGDADQDLAGSGDHQRLAATRQHSLRSQHLHTKPHMCCRQSCPLIRSFSSAWCDEYSTSSDGACGHRQ